METRTFKSGLTLTSMTGSVFGLTRFLLETILVTSSEFMKWLRATEAKTRVASATTLKHRMK
jgi:hypothetical protein